jgi:tetratricopeptide (TPR) repeat protein
MKSKKPRAGNRPSPKAKECNPALRPRLNALVVMALCMGASLGAYWLTLKLLNRTSTDPVRAGASVGRVPAPVAVPTNPSAPPLAGAVVADEPPAATPLDTNDPVQVLNYGTELLSQGRVREAIALYDRAAVLSPEEDEEVSFNLGVAFSRLAKTAESEKKSDLAKALFAEAMKHYRRALELLPDYAEAHNNLGNILIEQKRFDEAATHLVAAVQANPENSSAINTLGKCLALQGKLTEALGQFQKAVELNTNSVEARFNLGNACMALGRFDDAVREFELLLQMNPEFELAARRLAEAKAKKPAPPK